jgi:hypothetical protein
MLRKPEKQMLPLQLPLLRFQLYQHARVAMNGVGMRAVWVRGGLWQRKM